MADETPDPKIQDDWSVAFSQAKSEATAGRRKNPTAPKKNEQVSPEIKEVTEIANALADPIYWEGLVRGPADYMLATTGHKHWDIPDREIKSVTVPLAFSAKTFIHLDPRIILAVILIANIGKVYGPRVMTEYNMRKAAALDAVEKRDIKS